MRLEFHKRNKLRWKLNIIKGEVCTTSCRQPAALSGAHLAHSPLPARENVTDAERILGAEEKAKANTMIGAEGREGGVRLTAGRWLEGGGR